jgi:hypothetical protein
LDGADKPVIKPMFDFINEFGFVLPKTGKKQPKDVSITDYNAGESARDEGAIEIPITTSAVDALPPHVGHYPDVEGAHHLQNPQNRPWYQCNRLADRPLNAAPSSTLRHHERGPSS